jgi:hypothetical protein
MSKTSEVLKRHLHQNAKLDRIAICAKYSAIKEIFSVNVIYKNKFCQNIKPVFFFLKWQHSTNAMTIV